jgi:hypothetical protein
MPTNTISNDLHAIVVEAIQFVRECFADADIGRFDFAIEASGRTMTDADEVKIEYRIGDRYSSEKVTGNSLANVVSESLRRMDWNHRNAPLALAKPRNNDE